MVRVVPDIAASPARTSFFGAPGVAPPQNFSARQIGNTGRGLQALSGVLAAEGQGIQDEVDDAQSKEATNNYAKWLQSTLRDPESGYFRTLGKGAFEGHDAIQAAIEARQEEIEGELQTEAQRELFRAQTDAMVQEEMRSVDEHAARQLRRFNVDETRAALETRIERAVARFDPDRQPDPDGEPDPFLLELGIAKRTAEELADLAQLPADSEQRRAMVQGATTRVHAAAVEQLINAQRYADATAYLEGTGDQMSPAAKHAAREVIKAVRVESDTAAAALDFEDRLLEARRGAAPIEQIGPELPPELGPELPPDESPQGPPQVPQGQGAIAVAGYRLGFLTQARDELDNQVRAGQLSAKQADAMFQRIEKRHKLRLDEIGRIESKALAEAEALLISNPEATAHDIAQLRPDLYQVLRNGGQLGALVTFNNSNNRRVNDWRKYAEMLTPEAREMMRRTPKDAFFAMTWGMFDSKHHDRVMELHAEANGDDHEAFSLMSELKRSEMLAYQLGIFKRGQKQTPEQQVRYGELLHDLEQRARAAGLNSGSDPAEFEEKVIQPALRDKADARVPGTFFDDVVEMPLIGMTTEQRRTATIRVAGEPEPVKLADISERAQAYLVDLLRQRRELVPGEPPVARLGPKEYPTGAMLAQAWVDEGKPRSVAGQPGELVTIDGQLISKDTALENPVVTRQVLDEIPQHVREAIIDRVTPRRTSRMPREPLRRSFGVDSLSRPVQQARAARADEIYNEWIRLGQPATLEAFRSALRSRR